jgi:hypothetical protein
MVPKNEKQRAQAPTEPVDEDKFKAAVTRLLNTPPQHRTQKPKTRSASKGRVRKGKSRV